MVLLGGTDDEEEQSRVTTAEAGWDQAQRPRSDINAAPSIMHAKE